MKLRLLYLGLVFAMATVAAIWLGYVVRGCGTHTTSAQVAPERNGSGTVAEGRVVPCGPEVHVVDNMVVGPISVTAFNPQCAGVIVTGNRILGQTSLRAFKAQVVVVSNSLARTRAVQEQR